MQLLTAGKENVVELAFAPDGRALVATTVQAVPVLWELPATGEPVCLGGEPTYSPRGITFTSGGAVVGWLADRQRREFDRRTGTHRTAHPVRAEEILNAQAVCGPDGRLVVRTVERNVGGWSHALTPDGRDGWSEAWVVGPAFGLGGWTIAAATAIGRFFTWERHGKDPKAERLFARSALTGEVQAGAAVPASTLSALATPPDGSVVVGFHESSLYAWRPGEKVRKVRTGTRRHYRDLAFHPDGRHLLAGNNDTTARLIDTHTWEVVRQYTWDVGGLTAVAVSPDGALGAAGGTKGRVVVWDLDL